MAPRIQRASSCDLGSPSLANTTNELSLLVIGHEQVVHSASHRHIKQLSLFLRLLTLMRHIAQTWNTDYRKFQPLTAVHRQHLDAVVTMRKAHASIILAEPLNRDIPGAQAFGHLLTDESISINHCHIS